MNEAFADNRQAAPASRHGPQGQSNAVRRVRLYTGLVLLAFVSTHLLNHSLGLISLAAMESGRGLFLALWRSPPGAALLLGSLVTHLGLAFWSVYVRRHLRMPIWEALQLLLGVCIPLFLIDHAVNTGVANARHGFQDSYTMLVLVYWKLRPEIGISQALLLTVAWVHGCIGVHYWLRLRPWYPHVRMSLYTLAVLLPVLALLGFAQAGRYVSTLAGDPEWVRQTVLAASAPDAAAAADLARLRDAIRAALAALLVLTFAARALRQYREGSHSVRITYPGGRIVSVPVGFSVLESSRQAGIAHASVCGGRGRCSTCRIRVLPGAVRLPEPSAAEKRVLTRVGAAPNVRLACQLRPVGDLAVIPLIPPSIQPSFALARAGIMAGEEREICVLFADLRGFTRIAEQRLPYDVVFLLNRYFDTVGGAIEGAGGIANQFTGDGVMALFGVQTGPAKGARQALEAARAMQRELAQLSADLREELPANLRLGIGIHCGPTVVGHMGRGVATYLTAVGDTVNTASRLQDQTKHFACQLIISESVARQAGIDVNAYRREEISVRNRDEPIAIRIIEDVESLPLETPRG
jgi:adenylate cyclase